MILAIAHRQWLKNWSSMQTAQSIKWSFQRFIREKQQWMNVFTLGSTNVARFDTLWMILARRLSHVVVEPGYLLSQGKTQYNNNNDKQHTYRIEHWTYKQKLRALAFPSEKVIHLFRVTKHFGMPRSRLWECSWLNFSIRVDIRCKDQEDRAPLPPLVDVHADA